MDLLLDLRWQLRHRTNAEETLRLFCELRRQLEDRNYLTFYRLRRCLENHLEAQVSSWSAPQPLTVQLRLDHYCVEAIRRVALCSAMRTGIPLAAPRLRFTFQITRPVPAEPLGIGVVSPR
jgi:hypothetical protein